MRLVALVASAILLVASSANAHVFDPTASFLSIRIGALTGGSAGNVQGVIGANGNAILSGGAGSEVIVEVAKGMGKPNIWQVEGRESGTEFFTGTPTILNLFFTIQHSDATFTHSTGKGTFQGDPICAPGGNIRTTSCFGGGPSGLLGQVLVDVGVGVGVPVGVIGAGGKTTVSLGSAFIAIEGAQWFTGTASITNIATNVIRITNNAVGPHGGRLGQTGAGFTLAATVNENTDILTVDGITNIALAGSTSFGPNPQQVTLVSPVHINASTVTGRPPIPGVAVQVLRYVPEPGTMLLLGSAVAGLLVVGRKRMKR